MFLPAISPGKMADELIAPGAGNWFTQALTVSAGSVSYTVPANKVALIHGITGTSSGSNTQSITIGGQALFSTTGSLTGAYTYVADKFGLAPATSGSSSCFPIVGSATAGNYGMLGAASSSTWCVLPNAPYIGCPLAAGQTITLTAGTGGTASATFLIELIDAP